MALKQHHFFHTLMYTPTQIHIVLNVSVLCLAVSFSHISLCPFPFLSFLFSPSVSISFSFSLTLLWSELYSFSYSSIESNFFLLQPLIAQRLRSTGLATVTATSSENSSREAEKWRGMLSSQIYNFFHRSADASA